MNRKPRAYIRPVFRPDGVTALAVIRRQKGITQEQLAEKVDMTSTAIIGYEKGNRTRPNTAQKIADALGEPLSELWIVEVASAS